jgi:protocatechuate 3,4-dioxygenase beta subunit
MPGLERPGGAKEIQIDVSVTALCKSGEAAGSRAAESGHDGTFRLGDLPAGLYELTAIAPTLRSRPETVGVGIAETSAVTLRVGRAVPITGDVLVDGSPCPHGRGSLVGPSSGAAEIHADGRLRFDGILPGRYSLEVECDGAVTLREVLEVASGPLQRTWELESGLQLLGRVESTRAQPVGGAIVNVIPLDGGQGTRSCSSDEAGDFACTGLVPGRYQCVLSNRHGKAEDHATVDLDGKRAPFVVLRTRSVGTIRASVRGNDPDLAGLRVFARQPGDFPVRGVASEGGFIFEDLPLGRYLVSIGRARERPAPGDGEVSLSRDGEVVDVTVSRPPLASIDGRVVDMRGDPIGDARVRVEVSPMLEADETTVDARCVTDENGAFVLDDLPPGHYDLIASTAFGEVALKDLAAGARDVRMVLRDYGAISGVVRRPLGEPLTSFRLSYASEEEAKSDQIDSPDGAWSLPWLAPGDYTLSVTSSEGSASARVTLGAGKRETVILTVAGRE